MASRIVAAARQAATVSRISTTQQTSLFLQRRAFAGAADHHGPPKVNSWQDPTSPSKWKEEHFVIVSLSGWGLLIYGGYKLFSGGKGEEKVAEASH
ncbi:uncharacterized protein LOC141633125 [Silene latifolia]|uniref:uncharacterized protein LOC141633125 n=1 Tax=Silene latifolia TaxID=37657 RepID=UPI003D77898A